MDLDISGTEVVVAVILWLLMSFVIGFLPDLMGLPSYPWHIKIITFVVLAPMSYFIVRYVAGQG